MRYLLGIPVVNRPDLLARAVRSAECCWPSTLIVDNSAAGLDPACWPVPILRPPVPLSFSQTMNLLQRLASERYCDALLFMHNDAEAEPGTLESLLAVVDEAVRGGRRWGVAFTHYDTLAAISLTMVPDVGPWDTALPHYFADNDYYRRVRLAGYEILDTGLGVIHHNGASSTIKSDPCRLAQHHVTFPLYESYYTQKWGGRPGQEVYRRPFDRPDSAAHDVGQPGGSEPMLFVEHLRHQPLFQELAASFETIEGNLLERADPWTTEAQIETIRYLVQLTQARRVLETGTNKSLFGYVLSHLTHDACLYTFDGDPRCATGVELLNASQRRVRSVFMLGDTKQTLPAFDVPGIDLAWIDGGHDEATALNDLTQAMRLAIPVVAVDDARTIPDISRAIDAALQANPAYRLHPNPFYEHDRRGIVILRRQADPSD